MYHLHIYISPVTSFPLGYMKFLFSKSVSNRTVSGKLYLEMQLAILRV